MTKKDLGEKMPTGMQRHGVATLCSLLALLACASTETTPDGGDDTSLTQTPVGGGGSTGNVLGTTTSSGGTSQAGGQSAGGAATAVATTGGATASGGSVGAGGAMGAVATASGGSGGAATNASAGATGIGGGAVAMNTGGSGGSTGGAGDETAMAGAGGTRGDGTAGSGAGGMGMGGGASGTDCSAFQLCEDFESGSLDETIWDSMASGAFELTVDTDQAHSGMYALHVVAPNSSARAFITETETFPASDFWGRAWLRFSGPEGGHQVFIIVEAPGDQLRVLNRRDGSESFAVNVESTDKWYQSDTNIPQTTWFCYEWHVTADSATIYYDGTELSDVGAPGISGATGLSLGFQRWQPGAEGELWVDDIAVSDTQIGCD